MPWELPRILNAEVARDGIQRLEEHEVKAPTDQSPLGSFPFALVSLLESGRYMRNQLLRDADWVSMAFSLEIRVPFVDHVLTEQVSGLAITGRLGPDKQVLTRTLLNGIPRSARERPKTGFTVPSWRWLNQFQAFDSWKAVPFLRRTNNRPERRWAYALIAQNDQTRDLLETG